MNSVAVSSTSSDESAAKPKNISCHLWEKFKALEKRTNEVTKRSTEKRIKHLQLDVLDTVNREFTTDEDKDILREHDVKFGPRVDRLQTNRKRQRKGKDGQSEEETSSGNHDAVKILEPFMGLNDHLITTDYSRPPPPTALEEKIDEAICKGDVATAETLSDHLAKRQAGERIVGAIESKRFLEEQEKTKETAKMKKKKKLAWGFEHKLPWEMKGNM